MKHEIPILPLAWKRLAYLHDAMHYLRSCAASKHVNIDVALVRHGFPWCFSHRRRRRRGPLLVGRFVGAARLKEPPALHGKEIWLREQDFAKWYPQQLSINAISRYDCIHMQTELILPLSTPPTTSLHPLTRPLSPHESVSFYEYTLLTHVQENGRLLMARIKDCTTLPYARPR